MAHHKSKASPVECIVIALILFAIGGVMMFRHKHLQNVCSKTATATVTDCRSHTTRQNGRTKTSYTSTLSFKADGQTYRFTLPSKSTRDSLGREYSIRYNPKNPHECFAPSKSEDGIFFLGAGVLLFAIGLVGALFKKREQRNSEFY